MLIYIADKKIGDGQPVFFIAEAGVNHNGSIELGKQLIEIAKEAGADAVKFQTFKTENIITKTAPKSTYHIETTGEDKHQSWFDLLKTQEMSMTMHVELIEHCKKVGIIFLSTPYDEESADLLDGLGVPAFKIASTDTGNIPLLRYIAKKGRPMILSSAMATMTEVENAVFAVRDEGLQEVAMLQCTGNYPAKIVDTNLRVMDTYRKQLKCVVGYSDHTQELINPIAATAMGACIYEKHFTVDRSLPGPDHRMSLKPEELIQTITAIRNTETAMGSSIKNVLDVEKENRVKLRKSVVANVNINKGEIIQKEMLALKRPGHGIQPTEFNKVIGKTARSDIPEGSVLLYEMLNDR
jgi:N,N'-diacetyllegionaminate synthase